MYQLLYTGNRYGHTISYLCGGLARNTFANGGKIDEILAIHGHSWSGPAMKTPLGVKLVVEGSLERSYLIRHRRTRIKPLVYLRKGISFPV